MAARPTSATTRASKAGFDATQTSLIAFFEIGQLIIAVIAALAITSEYSTGMIRTSLTAQPRRGTIYAAKAIVLTSLTLIVSLVTSFIAFFVGQALLSSSGVSASLFHSVTIPQNANVTCPQQGPGGGGGGGLPPGCKVVFSGTDVIHPSTVLLAIIGCALFVTLVAILAFGIGAIVRHTAGAIAIAIAALFIIPVLEQALPTEWRWDIMRFLPDAANQVVSVTIGDNANAAPVVGLAAARRDSALGRGAARRGRLPVPQARRISQNRQVKPSSQPNGAAGPGPRLAAETGRRPDGRSGSEYPRRRRSGCRRVARAA